jgi:hypothetical protein
VPDESVYLGKRHPRLVQSPGFVGIEQAEFDPVGDLAEQREIGTRAVIGRTERVRLAPPRFQSASVNLIRGGHKFDDTALGDLRPDERAAVPYEL